MFIMVKNQKLERREERTITTVSDHIGCVRFSSNPQHERIPARSRLFLLWEKYLSGVKEEEEKKIARRRNTARRSGEFLPTHSGSPVVVPSRRSPSAPEFKASSFL